MKLAKFCKLITEIGDMSKIDSYPFTVMGLTTEFISEVGNIKVEFTRLVDFKSSIQYPPIMDLGVKIVGYNIQYTVEGTDMQFQKTNYSVLIKILKTVTDIILETILKNDNYSTENFQNIYCIGSVSKLGKLKSDDQKDLIYRQIAKYNLPIGYRIHEIKFKDINIDGIGITINKLKK